MVVTGLWVEHCFKIGLTVDPTSVMYQPPKDLNGIPGAKNLVVCLTGYQRQDRDDVMTMVSLMGAQFSRQLIAIKVTHLVCYKFEGDKYELARKMKKIKLVNHRWLEDCLRNWKLLPEEEYNKSGYELEMMEAEARDSEDDMPDISPRPSTIRIANHSPQITKTGPSTTYDLSKSTSTMPNVPAVLSTVHSASSLLIDPVSRNEPHVSDLISGPLERTPGSAKAGTSKMNSVSGSIQKPSPSTLVSYNRRTPQRSPSPLSISASKSSGRSQKVQTEEPTTNVSFAEVEDANGKSAERLVAEEASDGEKQELNASKSSSKSHEIGHDRQACITGSSSGLHRNLPDEDRVPFITGMVTPIAASNSNSNCSEAVRSRETSLANGLLPVPLSGNTTLEKTESRSTRLELQSSLGESKESNSPCNQDSGDHCAEKSKLAADLGNHQEGGDSLATKTDLETEKTSVLNMNQRQDDSSLPRQVKKQSATKKTVGSRLKTSVKKKGLLHLKETPVQEDTAIDSCKGNDKTNDTEKAAMSKEVDNQLPSVAPMENLERELFMEDETDKTTNKESISEEQGGDRRKKSRVQARKPSTKSTRKKASTTATDNSNSSHSIQTETHLRTVNQAAEKKAERNPKPSRKRSPSSMEADKENNPITELHRNGSQVEPMCFILSGSRVHRKEFQQVIRRLKGKCCRDSHQWSYQATHFIAPDPIRRTEKFFAASASGSWILRPEYLSACSKAGKFLPEEPYELYKNGLSEDGAMNLEAPRKWRLMRERTGHGAFYGMRIVVYGQCISPPLDTLKRVVKAGDGAILATSPPYNRFLTTGVDYAVVGPGIPAADVWVQQFLQHEIPCVAADYLVEYVCKAGYPLDKHVLYNTQKLAEKSFAKLAGMAAEVVDGSSSPEGSSRKKRRSLS
ncbi:BRCT domain-containing protein At4g02110 [Linum perenne]